MGKRGGGYYAVAQGRSTGVYTTWSEAEAQVKGFAGAKFKKFASQAEANAFVQQFGGDGGGGNDGNRGSGTPFVVGSSGNAAVPAPALTAKRGRDDDNVKDYQYPFTDVSPPQAKRVARVGLVVAATSSPPSAFYAVAEGHSTGIFTNWSEVLQETEGYDRPVYRKFSSRDAAHAYLAGYGHGQKRSSTTTTSSSSASTSAPADTSPSHAQHSAWYAVAKGRRTGVFAAWAEAKPQVEGLFSAKFKKFPTRDEAEAFVAQHQSRVQPLSSDPDPKHPDTLVAFCDGSALQNGRRGCQAGYACIFPHNLAWNVAQKMVEVRATNNRAEYLAALEAMKRANMEDASYARPLFIFSDSMLLIRSMTEWVTGWQKKNWVKADGQPVMNRDLLERLVQATGPRRIIWRHVKAHTGRSDWQSKWNDVADNAARNAAAGWEPKSE